MSMMNGELAIRCDGLSRSFKTSGKTIEAVKGIDLSVEMGEIVGFLGPNGAGKTTTLKMLCTLLEPTGGKAWVAGYDLRTDPRNVRRSIGYVAQGGSTVSEATVDLEIVSQAQLYGMGRREAEEHGRALLKALDLDGVWRRQCGTLSGGQRRRLDIVMGLIHRPRLVFLDEPSTGLDPQSRANLWSHIRKLRDELGTTVFLTTHYMDEADSLSDRLLIIDQGRIVAGGTSAQLKQQLSGDSITLTLKAEEDLATAGQALKSMDGVDLVSAEGNVIHLQVKDGSAVMPAILRALSNCGVEPIGVETARPTLDDVFLSLTGRSLRD